MKNHLAKIITVLFSLTLVACGSDSSSTNELDTSVELPTSDNSAGNESTDTEFTLSSDSMVNNGNLPVTFTCDGESISPPLTWSGTPENTSEFALVMHHVPGPDEAKWYWIMYGIDAAINSIDAGEIEGVLGTNSVNGLNEYAAPCSQGPGSKSYTFTLYALSDSPELSNVLSVDRESLLTAMADITLNSVELSVNFDRYADVELTRCEMIQQSVSEAGFNESVGVTCDDEYAYISSDTYPDHDLMNGITGTNEQLPVPATNYAAPIKLAPQLANNLTTIDAAVGVAVNGVPIYDYLHKENSIFTLMMLIAIR